MGSGACLPFFSLLWFRCLSPFFSLLFSSGKGFCSIMICWFLLVPARVRVFVSLLLSSFFLRKGLLFHHDLLVSPGSGWVPVLVSFLLSFSYLRKGVLFHHDLLVPLGSGWVSGACPCLPSSLCFLSSGQGFCSIMDLLVPPASGLGSGACLPSSPFFWLFGVYAGVICLR